MARLNVRSNTRMPVTLMVSGPENRSFMTATANVGLGGAYIDAPLPLPEKAIVDVKSELPNSMGFETTGRVARKEENGVAVEFINMDRASKSLLWQYIAETLPKEDICPYCRHENQEHVEKCQKCGLSINFDSDTYLDIHEEELRERWTAYIDAATEKFLERIEDVEREIRVEEMESSDLDKKLMEIADDFLIKAERFEHAIGDEVFIKRARVKFRYKTNQMLSKSYFLNRARVWPQGYQGDYKTLEGMYRNVPASEGLGYFIDKAFLSAPLAMAVRSRIVKLEEILREEIQKRSKPSILNIACGSCRELMGLAAIIKEKGAQVMCLDYDDDALAFSQQRLSYTGATSQMEFRKYNALRLFDDELNMKEFGKQDIIYSAGLFDYIPSDFLEKMFMALYRLLNPGGILIAAFKDAERYSPQLFHWMADWEGFLQRDENDFRVVFSKAGIPDSSISEVRDNTGIIVFYRIAK